MKKVRWGILGTGRIAHQFAQDMVHVDNGELVAVAAVTVKPPSPSLSVTRFPARTRAMTR